tara:strand:- start:776 stop:1123 length:348 start_codon:yes stop_codon:yes gene_type:complete
MAYIQKNNPFPVTSCGRRRSFMMTDDPIKLTDEAYEKSNREMRSEYTRETGKKLGKRLTKGKNKRRVSFACRFAGMKGPMKDSKGRPTRKAKALKKWGFGSVEAARNFCNKNKEK